MRKSTCSLPAFNAERAGHPAHQIFGVRTGLAKHAQTRRARGDDAASSELRVFVQAPPCCATRRLGVGERQKTPRAAARRPFATLGELVGTAPQDSPKDAPWGLVLPKTAPQMTGVVPANRLFAEPVCGLKTLEVS